MFCPHCKNAEGGECYPCEVKRLKAENDRMRGVLEELNMNANNLLAGGLGWFTKKDFAMAVADRSKYALGSEHKRSDSDG